MPRGASRSAVKPSSRATRGRPSAGRGAPKHTGAPAARVAHTRSNPPKSRVAPSSPSTSSGAAASARALPQQTTLPVDRRAHVPCSRATTSTASATPSTSTGAANQVGSPLPSVPSWLSPQHEMAPADVAAHANRAPTATSVTPERPGSSATGASLDQHATPPPARTTQPSAPWTDARRASETDATCVSAVTSRSLHDCSCSPPQHATVPSARVAHIRGPAPDSALASRSPGTARGADTPSVVAPSPRRPLPCCPQQTTSPPRRSAHVARPPATTSMASRTPGTTAALATPPAAPVS